MFNKLINFSEKYPDITLCSYIHEDATHPLPAIIVCPGGGYSMVCADYEGTDVAEKYYEAGFNAFVLDYYTGEKIKNLEPTVQIALSVKYVREHAAELKTDPEKILTCGFSAGGHLAGSAGILWNIPEVKEALGDATEGINRPNGMILCYPVVTAGEFAHRGSFANLTGNSEYGEAEINKFSLEKNVDSTTPPMFIWHTVTDQIVPVQNSLLLVNAYLESNRPFEAHIYPKGPHGMGLCRPESPSQYPEAHDSHVGTWFNLSIEWLKKTF